MKLNILSAAIFILGAIGLLITKHYYLDDLYFSQKDADFIEKIRSNDDIEHLRSITLALLVIDDHNVKSYNNLLTNLVDLLTSLCFLAALFSVLAIISDKKGNMHSNQSLNSTPKSGAN